MDQAWIALGLSLKVAVWATLITLVLGTATGFALARLRLPGHELLGALLTLSMVLPAHGAGLLPAGAGRLTGFLASRYLPH